MFFGERCSSGKRQPKQDSCWSVVVCFCATLSQALIMGLVQGTFGIFLPVIMEQFDSGRGQTAWIGSLALGLSYFGAPVVGLLSNHFGCRLVTIFGGLICALSLVVTSFAKSFVHVFLSYGLLFGLGAACVRTCTFLVTAKYFYRRRSLATGIVSSGPGIGMFIYGPIVQELLDIQGLQNTYRVLTGFALFICILAVTFSSSVEEVEEDNIKTLDNQVDKDQQDHTKEKQNSCLPRRKCIDCSAWKTPAFTIVTIAYTVSCLGDFVPLMHLVKHCRELGIPGDSAARLIMFFGATSFAGRLLIGRLGDCKRVNSLHVIQVGFLTIAVSFLLLPMARSYPWFVVFSLVDGFCDGAVGSQLNLVLLTTVSPRLRATSFGYANCLVSLSLMMGPPVAGVLADKFNSYVPAFYLAGSEVLLGACITFVLCFLKSPKQQTENIDSDPQEAGDAVPLQTMHRTSKENGVEDKRMVHLVVLLHEEDRSFPFDYYEEKQLEVRCTDV